MFAKKVLRTFVIHTHTMGKPTRKTRADIYEEHAVAMRVIGFGAVLCSPVLGLFLVPALAPIAVAGSAILLGSALANLFIRRQRLMSIFH